MVAGQESCDSGSGNSVDSSCLPDCSFARCGDGILQEVLHEQCDDSNMINGDGCDEHCLIEITLPICGNGALEDNETCDDGNTLSGDGCDASCHAEEPQNPCDTNPCQNNGQCSDNGGMASCVCQVGYTGVFCENVSISCTGPEQCDDSDACTNDTCADGSCSHTVNTSDPSCIP